MLRSNHMVIQSNNEIKKLLAARSENQTSPLTTPVLCNDDHEQYSMKGNSICGDGNADLFKRIVTVYFYEEPERIKSNNVRKSARRVSVELGGTMCDFLDHRLQSTGLSFDRFPDGGDDFDCSPPFLFTCYYNQHLLKEENKEMLGEFEKEVKRRWSILKAKHENPLL
ncbi:hypothetical protein [Paenibacillus solani]|uniref:hypothetical protein n=1 Tax=Paenibacillus solani TaxID=1705565 RepID=UPI003D298507